MTPPVLILSRIPDDLRQALADRFGSLVDRSEVGDLPEAVVAVTMGTAGANAETLRGVPGLKLLACHGAGLEQIDLAAASRLGIAVTHTPDVVTDDTADQAVALVYAAARRTVYADRFVRAGRWASERIAPSFRVTGKAAGVVGLGRIGRTVADRLAGVGMRVAYTGPRPKPAPYDYLADLRELARRSDFLVLTTPGGAATRHLVDADVLAALGPDGILVNVSRGSVVDEAALLDALETGAIAGAGLDVFASEPNIDPRFLALDNVVLQPHNAAITRETRAAMIGRVIGDIEAFLEGRPFHNAAAAAHAP